MRLKKRKKYTRIRGDRTAGYAMKKHKGSGNRGGKGMAGTGKRADQRKSYVIRYMFPYFGKKGFTSKRKKVEAINLEQIEKNINKFLKSGIAKKSENEIEINLSGWKILGNGELKGKYRITANSASKSAKEKIEKAGSVLILKKMQEKEKAG